MKHSDIHAGSGTVVSIQDPATGMYLDLTYAPGQTHRVLHVMMNGKLLTAYARLIKLDAEGDEDLVLSVRAPSAPSDTPPVAVNPKPHPATVLRPSEETRAGREAVRSESGNKVQPTPNAPSKVHPATVQTPEDVTRAANEALRGTRSPRQEAERLQKEEQAAIVAMEPVMGAEELVEMYAEVNARREDRAKTRASDAPGLQTLIEGDVDLSVLNDFPMTDAEVASLHDDAKAIRTRESLASDSTHEFVEGDAKKKDGKKVKITLR